MTALLSDRIPLGSAYLSRIEYDDDGKIRALEAEDDAGKVLRIEFPPVGPEDVEMFGNLATLTSRPRPRVDVNLRYR